MASKCPLLEKYKVGWDSGASRTLKDPDTNWIKEICWKFCPPEEPCVLDYGYFITKKRKKQLLAIKIPLLIDGVYKCRRCKNGDVMMCNGDFECIQCGDEYSKPRQ